MGLVEKGAYRELYTRLSDVLRHFIEDVLRIEAMERTTAELDRDLYDTDLDEDTIERVAAFLSLADLVKFARHRPGAKIASAAVDAVRDLFDRLDVRPDPGTVAETAVDAETAGTEAPR